MGSRGAAAFDGFEPIDANYVYCPNQFFDVCLPYCSRGVVRLVAYMIRQTLGFRDANGNPIREDVSISYGDFVKAGVSRGAIRPAIDEAIAAGFIRCIEKGIAKSKNAPAQTARYMLRWGTEHEYRTDSKMFDGFYTGNGCKSPIPNAFFDEVVPRETLAVVKVVGTVLRFTVGYENHFGRRDQAPLPYDKIQQFTNLKHRPTLAEALRSAKTKGYICCVNEGVFDPGGRNSRAAVYAVKWLEKAEKGTIGSETEPGNSEQFKNRTGNGSITEPVDQFKNRTDRKTISKTSDKQQVVAENLEGFELLVQEGIGRSTAVRLSESATLKEIRQQIEWLDFRNPKNRAAMLRKAIEEGWSEPDEIIQHNQQGHTREREEQEGAVRAARETALADEQAKRQQRRIDLLARWQKQSTDAQRRHRQKALEQATSDVARRLIGKSGFNNPAPEILEVMAAAIAEPIGDSPHVA